ncbi:hypothetical protein EC991_008387 [Linnemannia zychae]|nr:hypothetical protein EC991_008387 [Linnemannia zychae]
MLGSFLSFAGALVLAMATSVSAQGGKCGGEVTDGMEGTFKILYSDAAVTVLTIYGLNNNQQSESYILYCNGTPLTPLQLLGFGLGSQVGQFKVPVQNVLVGGSYTSSYIELAGGRTQIKVLEDPKNIVSPCLQARVNNGSIVALDDSNPLQYDMVDVGFRIYEHPSQVKDVWVPMSVEVAPLLRVEYIKAIALFFNNGNQGEETYNKIKTSYEKVRIDMENIPGKNKKRIAWVKYDFSRASWTLRNSAFTRGLITDADNVTDNASISDSDFNILVSNADVIIDQTEFEKGTTRKYTQWLKLAGFDTAAVKPRVLDKKNVYSLDATANGVGISDYLYRMPSRPDLLLRDLVHVQYPEYDRSYDLRFLNKNFAYDQGPTESLGPQNCDAAVGSQYYFPYNSGDISEAPSDPSFRGDPIGPPALIGGGIYGAGGNSQGSEAGGGGGSKTKSITIAVVSVAAVLGAAFAFAFYKWSHRAKEDRFIELEEEMNNEIPLN